MGQPIEHVRPEGAFSHKRMVEVIGWIARHSETLHHPAGARVYR